MHVTVCCRFLISFVTAGEGEQCGNVTLPHWRGGGGGGGAVL
jgi:hypothetical protein